MPRPRHHWLDDLADDLFDWIRTETAVMTRALRSGGRSPFAARVTEDQKLAFYRRALFNPDGSPNEQGRQQTLARIGVEGYATVMRAVMKGGEQGIPDLDEDEEEVA
jgi:hypothetical protein